MGRNDTEKGTIEEQVNSKMKGLTQALDQMCVSETETPVDLREMFDTEDMKKLLWCAEGRAVEEFESVVYPTSLGQQAMKITYAPEGSDAKILKLLISTRGSMIGLSPGGYGLTMKHPLEAMELVLRKFRPELFKDNPATTQEEEA